MAHTTDLQLEIEPDTDSPKELWWSIFERDLEGSSLKPNFAASLASFSSGAAAQIEGDLELARFRAGGLLTQGIVIKPAG